MQRVRISIAFALPALALATMTAASATDGQSNTPDVLAGLKSIRQDADRVSTGKVAGKAIESPARDIALQWSKIAQKLADDGNVLVETKMANADIATFEKDWQTKKDIRSEAKDVSSSIADLVGAEKQHS